LRRKARIAFAALFLHFAAAPMKASSVFAAWLIVLILLPFTAPFSTCEVPNRLTPTSHGSPFVPHANAGVANDTATALVPARLHFRTGKSTTFVRRHLVFIAPPTVRGLAGAADPAAPTHGSRALQSVLRL